MKEFELVAIGVSTGGPLALQEVLSKIPGDFPAGIVIAQHMPPNFTKLLAERLNSISKIEVREAQNGEPIKPNLALIAQGGKNLIFEENSKEKFVKIVDEPDTLYKPSVDIMMGSAAEVFGDKVLGVIMTGMGKDGLEGLKKVKEKGGYVIAQSEETCVVYGMPKAVVEAGIADAVIPLDKIGETISKIVKNVRM